MKLFFLIVVLVIGEINTHAQNLIPNPSFEIQSSCPEAVSDLSTDEVSKASGWSSFRETPDYFDSCGGVEVSVPNNYWGYQDARTGSAYCGFQTYMAGSFREHIGCQLLESLTVGETYYVKFFVCAAKGGYFGATTATNKIGVKFSTIAYNYNNPIAINNSAHFYTNSIVSDTTNWTEISGSFVADSEYKYASFGNFFDNEHTDTINFETVAGRAYYFIEDICISESPDANCDIPLVLVTESIQEPLTIVFPNPATTSIQLHLPSNHSATLTLFDLLGEKVKEQTITGSNIAIDVSELPVGMYVVRVGEWSGKFVKE